MSELIPILTALLPASQSLIQALGQLNKFFNHLPAASSAL